MKIARPTGLALIVTWLAWPVLAEELRPIDRPEEVGFAGGRPEST